MSITARNRLIGAVVRAGWVAAAALTVLLASQAPVANAVAGSQGIDGAATTAGVATPLRLGSRGTEVRALQRTLCRLSYLPNGAIDGVFGMRTWHAVIAFQGWNHLQRDGVVGARTHTALLHARRPRPWSARTGLEIHLREQVLLLVQHRRVQRAIHVSTGAGGATPSGHFRIYRRDPMSWSVPFQVWMPLAQYFHDGFAVHEFASVPADPVSHGCVRVPQSESRTVWHFGTIGMRVWTRS